MIDFSLSHKADICPNDTRTTELSVDYSRYCLQRDWRFKLFLRELVVGMQLQTLIMLVFQGLTLTCSNPSAVTSVASEVTG